LYGERRTEIEDKLSKQIGDQLAQEGFILNDALIRDITFSPKFRGTVEAEQVAAQNATLTAQPARP
jgi:regulator of protease activity HflC (stomatin/prohibitin superfamily)